MTPKNKKTLFFIGIEDGDSDYKLSLMPGRILNNYVLSKGVGATHGIGWSQNKSS